MENMAVIYDQRIKRAIDNFAIQAISFVKISRTTVKNTQTINPENKIPIPISMNIVGT